MSQSSHRLKFNRSEFYSLHLQIPTLLWLQCNKEWIHILFFPNTARSMCISTILCIPIAYFFHPNFPLSFFLFSTDFLNNFRDSNDWKLGNTSRWDSNSALQKHSYIRHYIFRINYDIDNGESGLGLGFWF